VRKSDSVLRILKIVIIVFFRERQLNSAGGIVSIINFNTELSAVEINIAINDDRSK